MKWLNHILAPVDGLGHVLPTTQGRNGEKWKLHSPHIHAPHTHTHAHTHTHTSHAHTLPPCMITYRNSLFSPCTHTHAAVAPSSVDLSDQSASSAAAVGVCPPPNHTLPLSGHRQLSRLRQAAFLLYQSQPLCIIISRLEVSLCPSDIFVIHLV